MKNLECQLPKLQFVKIFQVIVDVKLLSWILSILSLEGEERSAEKNRNQIISIKVSLEVNINFKVTNWPLKLPYA